VEYMICYKHFHLLVKFSVVLTVNISYRIQYKKNVYVSRDMGIISV